MKANKVSNENKVNVFLAVIGAEAFELIMSYFSPDDPSEKNHDQLIGVLQRHYRQNRNFLVERVHLRERKQREGESISEFVELKRLSRFCEYGEGLEDNMRDTFVSGLRDAHIKKRLYTKSDLTWKTATETAIMLESATKDASVNAEQKCHTVNRVSSSTSQRGKGRGIASHPKSCHRCLGNHLPPNCPYIKEKCHRCHRIGHLKRACRSADPVGHQANRPKHQMPNFKKANEKGYPS